MASPEPTRAEHEAHTSADGVAQQTLETVRNPNGAVLVFVCATCCFVEAVCTHQQNSWRDAAGNKCRTTSDGMPVDGITLRCDLCGLDGT